MESNEHNGWIINALGVACAALASALGYVMKRKPKYPSAMIDSGPLIKAAMEVQEASTSLNEKLRVLVANVENYHKRTGELEETVVEHSVRLKAAELDIGAINRNDERQWEVISKNSGDVERLKGRLEGRQRDNS